ncbi:MAG TPA: adenylate/guanylate cyclase domain-containing protein, partial [Bryobacteraceae bacterium]|nr:adenylate/guanylate cyclase domain-containing protein [Bryobacteraceae bacterium]
SANGTFVNGRPVRGQVHLKSGDMVSLGGFKIRFMEEAPEDERFKIEAGKVDLDRLQKEGAILELDKAEAADGHLKNFEILYEVGVTLARSRSVEEVTSAALELLFKIDQVHRAGVVLWDEKKSAFLSPELHVRNAGRASSMGGAYDPSKLLMSQTILRRVRKENRPLLVRDAKSEESLDNAMSIVRAGIQAAFCSPLTYQGRFLGILYADNLAQPDAFSEADFRLFTSIAAQTGLALATAVANRDLIEREVEKQALARYVPPQVAELVLNAGGAARLNGDLQPVTVLYADIRGFTTISEKMDAREVVAMLRQFFSTMSAEIISCNGTVDKFIGDCIMALFGAPVHSYHAVREGLEAAIGMQRRMTIFNDERVQRGLSPIQIGIGLHCGPAVVGNIGSEDRVQYTAIGDTVNVAARLVSTAGPGQILASDAVRLALPDHPGFELLGDVGLKGRATRVTIFSVRWNEQPAAV